MDFAVTFPYHTSLISTIFRCPSHPILCPASGVAQQQTLYLAYMLDLTLNVPLRSSC